MSNVIKNWENGGHKLGIDTQGNARCQHCHEYLTFPVLLCGGMSTRLIKYIEDVNKAHMDNTTYNRGIRDMGNIIIEQIDFMTNCDKFAEAHE